MPSYSKHVQTIVTIATSCNFQHLSTWDDLGYQSHPIPSICLTNTVIPQPSQSHRLSWCRLTSSSASAAASADLLDLLFQLPRSFGRPRGSRSGFSWTVDDSCSVRSFLAPSSTARSPVRSFLVLVAMPGAPNSILAPTCEQLCNLKWRMSDVRQRRDESSKQTTCCSCIQFLQKNDA